MNRTALFGGSFNPVHNGHINLVKQIKEKNNIDKVIVIPTHISPFKAEDNDFVADSADRINMLKLAFTPYDYVDVSSFETDRNGISYTIDTVRHFREILPDDKLFLIIGSDMMLSFTKWKDYKQLLELCTVITSSRETDDKDALLNAQKDLSVYGEIIITDIEPIVISSTTIREKIKKYEDISCYMPLNVVKYIENKELYYTKEAE